MKRKRSTLTHWLREGKRLKRLDDVALVVDDDIQIFNYSMVQTNQLEKYLIPQNFLDIKMKVRVNSNQEYSISLTQLPFDILENICHFLTIQDITNLTQVNQDLYSSLMGTYVPFVSLPLKTEYLGQIRKRRILRLNSCCYLSLMPGIETFQPFKQLNLSYLKELKLLGRNIDMGSRLCLNSRYCLGNTYLNTLRYILGSLSPISLQSVDLLTDDTQECVEVYKYISRFYRLRKVTLHGIGYCCWFSSDISCTQAIVDEVLKLNLKELSLVKFNATDVRINQLNIESKTLETFTVVQTKVLSFGTVSLPSVRTLNTEMSLGTCIYDVRTLVSGCPELKFWNGFDVEKYQPIMENIPSEKTCTESNITKICLDLGLHKTPY